MRQVEVLRLIRKLSKRRHRQVIYLSYRMKYPALYEKEIRTAKKAIADFDSDIDNLVGRVMNAPLY